MLTNFLHLMVVVLFMYCLSLSLSKLDLMMISVKLPGLVVLIFGDFVLFMASPPHLPWAGSWQPAKAGGSGAPGGAACDRCHSRVGGSRAYSGC